MPSITTAAWLCASLLSLSPLAAAATPAAADFYVKDLPGLPKDGPVVKMHAGHIEITPEHNGNLFFWHFQNQHIANKQRTVIWLNGGPGCSSEDGALMEIGPYRVNDQKNLVHNNGSWNEFANLLFVDNPVGTGFSYVDTDSYVTELEEMAKQFIQFLEQWFEIFPEYALDDLYIAGESYAGQHIPYITKALLERNKQKPDKAWKLSGLLIGNGWISPIQYKSYIPFAFEKGLIEKGSNDANQLSGMYRNCERLLFGSEKTAIDIDDCESIMTEILAMTRRSGKDDACLNMYDVRLRDSYPSCGMNWPPDLINMNPYLRQDNVTAALHIDPRKTTGWEECNGNVGGAFRRTRAKPAGTLLPDILKEVPVLLFSGAEDLICNHIGTEDFISSMEWNGGKGFEVSAGNWAPRRDWTFEGEAAGFWQEARNLTYVLFYNSSHMVPFDYPRRSRDMLDRFMKIDISSIGGQPTDSRIDGERGPETSVEGSDNSKAQKDKAQKEIQEAKWLAYRRAGEVALVFVSIAAALFGYFVWRQRRKEASYSALKGEDPNGRRHRVDDLEARAFADDGVDDISLQENIRGDDHHYGVGDDSEDEEAPREKGKGKEKPAA